MDQLEIKCGSRNSMNVYYFFFPLVMFSFDYVVVPSEQMRMGREKKKQPLPRGRRKLGYEGGGYMGYDKTMRKRKKTRKGMRRKKK